MRYGYDAFGRLASRTVGEAETRYVYEGDRLLAEIGPGERLRTWVYGPELDEPLAYEENSRDTLEAWKGFGNDYFVDRGAQSRLYGFVDSFADTSTMGAWDSWLSKRSYIDPDEASTGHAFGTATEISMEIATLRPASLARGGASGLARVGARSCAAPAQPGTERRAPFRAP